MPPKQRSAKPPRPIKTDLSKIPPARYLGMGWMFTVRFIPDQQAFFMAVGCERYEGNIRLPYCYWFVRRDQACILLFGLWSYGWMRHE